MKVNYAIFDVETGVFVERGFCDDSFLPRPKEGRGIYVGKQVDCRRQKIVCSGLDEYGRAVQPQIIDVVGSREKMPKDGKGRVTKEEFDELLKRVEVLEGKVG